MPATKVKASSKHDLEQVLLLLGKLNQRSKKLTMAETKLLEDWMPMILGQATTLSGRVGLEPFSFRHYLAARAAFRSDSELAEGLGVNRSTVARWKQGQPPEAKNRETLVNIDIVVSLLSGYLEEGAIPDWLSGTNPMLGNRRPIDVLRAGRVSEVVVAIEAERAGAFA